MKTNQHGLLFSILALLASLPVAHAAPLGAAFTYQGKLTSGTNAASGSYDLKFSLYDALTSGNQVGNSLTNTATAISNGYFTVTLDFGAMFDGNARWLETGVRTNGSGAFTTLSPRQPLTPSPYALYAPSAGTATMASSLAGILPGSQLSGTYSNAVTFNNAANSFTGNGAGLTSLNASQLSSGTVPGAALGNAWKTSGNTGTSPGANFLGTADYQPLELKVSGTRALRLEPTVNDSAHSNIVNIVGGSPVNYVAPGVYGSVIVGGGVGNYQVSGPMSNRVSADLSFLGGGVNNSIQPNAGQSVLGGGNGNSIQSWAGFSFLGGGTGNTIQGDAIQGGTFSFLGGGWYNSIQGSADGAVLGGGEINCIQAGANNAFVGGGSHNTVRTNAAYSFLGGGYYNTNSGPYSVVAGGSFNSALGTDATVSGGYTNSAGGQYATVGGGSQNTANLYGCTVAGGLQNTAGAGAGAAVGGGSGNRANGNYALVSGGLYNNANTVKSNSQQSTIAGGIRNVTGDYFAAVGGGISNSATARAATVPGGWNNLAGGEYSFAAGRRSKATHQGTVVWADSNDVDFDPYALSGPQGVPNSFNVRSTGGFYIVTGVDGSGNILNGMYLYGGGSGWNSYSDRNAKTNCEPVDSRTVLEKVAALPITTWNYKTQDPSIRHLGPMAQDFAAAFGLGESEKTINTVDADGVALAAIQGLNQKLDQDVAALREELQRRDAENASLKQELSELKNLVNSLTQKLNEGVK